MLRKIVFSLVVLLGTCGLGVAQTAPAKVLFLVNTGIEQRFEFGLAIWHALQLKASGMDVHVVVEGEGVAFLLGKDKMGKYFYAPPVMSPEVILSSAPGVPPGERRVSEPPAREAQDISQSGVKPGKDELKDIWRSKQKLKVSFNGAQRTGDEQVEVLVAELKAKVPYTVCGLSVVMLGMEKEFKAAGIKLSSPNDVPVDLSRFLKEGYQLAIW